MKKLHLLQSMNYCCIFTEKSEDHQINPEILREFIKKSPDLQANTGDIICIKQDNGSRIFGVRIADNPPDHFRIPEDFLIHNVKEGIYTFSQKPLQDFTNPFSVEPNYPEKPETIFRYYYEDGKWLFQTLGGQS